MDIIKYTSFFHDGSIIDIKHANNGMIISMESAEMDEGDIENGVILSKNKRIRGKLHIEGVQNIIENDMPCVNAFAMKSDDAEIFHLEISKNKTELQIIWNSYPLNSRMETFSTIKIAARNIWWENIPDLEDANPK